MRKNIFLLTFIAVVLFLTSCVTSFETGQEAATLTKNDLAVGFDAGSMKAALSARYGLIDKLDLGTSCNFRFNEFSGKASSISVSGDFKWQFFGEPANHFVLATGAGFGTGIERTTLWNELYEPGEDEAWYRYGGTSYDAYLPLYFSYYISSKDGKDLISLNCNPYIVYRFGFYDNYTGLGPGDAFTGYQKLDQVYGGTAFSIGVGNAKNSLLGIADLLYAGPHSPNGADEFELFIAYRHIFQFGKKN